MKDNKYSWDDLYDRAEDKAHLSPELRAKDNARENIRQLILEETEVDIENSECPEDDIEYYVGAHTVFFDIYGYIINNQCH